MTIALPEHRPLAMDRTGKAISEDDFFSFALFYGKRHPVKSGRPTCGPNACAASAPSPELWVGQFGDRLYRFALLRVPDRSAAEELVQETFLAALKDRESFRGQCEFATWLVGILKHKLIDHLRKTTRQTSLSETPDETVDEMFNRLGHWRNPPASWAADPAELAIQGEFLATLQVCLAALPEQQRQALILRMIDEEPAEQVCKILNLTPTNLWVRLHRARLRLRLCLENKWFGHPVARPRSGTRKGTAHEA